MAAWLKEKLGERPFITYFLLSVNALVFLILELLGDTEDSLFMFRHGAMFTDAIAQKGEYWRLFTAMFLHFGANHIFSNMLVLFALGSRLEQGLGHWRFGLVYLFSGLGANLFSHMTKIWAGENILSAGASGAVFGLMGAMIFCGLFDKERIGALSPGQVMIMLGLSFYHGVGAAVDDMAHLSGLGLGFLLTGLLIFTQRSHHERLRF